MFVLNAKSSWDVDANQNIVEITTTRWLPGTGWNRHTDFLYTKPRGDWNNLTFSRDDGPKYYDFLNTMVDNNLEVERKKAQVCANLVVENGSWTDFVKLMNNLTIMDTTFEPPVINLRCRWQRELLESMCNSWTQMVISTCLNQNNLSKFSRVVDAMMN